MLNPGKKPLGANDKKIMFSLLFAVMPLFLILFCYLKDEESAILIFISDMTVTLPATISSTSPLLSKAMDVYCKTAPLFAIIVFFFTKVPIPSVKTSLKERLVPFLSCNIFLFTALYLFSFTNQDLAALSKVLKLMSLNIYSLTFFYVSLYFIFYSLTIAYLFIFVHLCRYKKDQACISPSFIEK